MNEARPKIVRNQFQYRGPTSDRRIDIQGERYNVGVIFYVVCGIHADVMHTSFNGLYSFFVDSIRFAMEKRFFLSSVFWWISKDEWILKLESHNRWLEKHFYMENSFWNLNFKVL